MTLTDLAALAQHAADGRFNSLEDVTAFARAERNLLSPDLGASDAFFDGVVAFVTGLPALRSLVLLRVPPSTRAAATHLCAADDAVVALGRRLRHLRFDTGARGGMRHLSLLLTDAEALEVLDIVIRSADYARTRSLPSLRVRSTPLAAERRECGVGDDEREGGRVD